MTAKLIVMESGDKARLNHPGGEAVLEKAGGKDAGLPFFAFLDDHGKLLVNTLRPAKGNIGHPFATEEIDWFLHMLGQAAPSMQAGDRKTIETWLRNQKR